MPGKSIDKPVLWPRLCTYDIIQLITSPPIRTFMYQLDWTKRCAHIAGKNILSVSVSVFLEKINV